MESEREKEKLKSEEEESHEEKEKAESNEEEDGQEDDEEQTYYFELLGSCAIGIGTCLRLASRSVSSDSARVTPEPEGEPEEEGQDDIVGEAAPAADAPEQERREEPGQEVRTRTPTRTTGMRNYPFDVELWRLERRAQIVGCMHAGWTDLGSNQYQSKWTCVHCGERWNKERPEWTRKKAERSQRRTFAGAPS